VGAPGELLVEGERFNLRKFYFETRAVRAKDGDEKPRSGPGAQSALEGDVRWIEAYNATVHQINAPVVALLRRVVGEVPGLGDDREKWRAWWTDQQGYAYVAPEPSPKPTFVQAFVTPPPAPPADRDRNPEERPHHSCFAAGTPVRTLVGPRPIESLRIGDRVLSQDPRTGVLGYQPVVAVFHNPPNQTLRIATGDDAIVATGIHRFWVAGKGWAMARDLRPGDAIRTLGGTSRVAAVQPAATQPVFNLELAGGHSFFVGGSGALVHDNSPVQPTPEPFDGVTPPSLAGAAAR
jgi:hypothetical protein